MNKKVLLLVAVLLILIGGAGVGVLFIGMKVWQGQQSNKDNLSSEESLGIEEQEEVLTAALDEYSSVESLRAEGEVTIISGGSTYSIGMTVMSKGLDESYVKLVMEEESLHLHNEIIEEEVYIYVSDGTDTVRFKLVEGSTGEEIYTEVESYYPADQLEEIQDEEEEDSLKIEYVGVEACRDMRCHKYIITDTSLEEEGKLTVWLDTQERLVRIVSMDSDDMRGLFDVYYEDVAFDIPDEYEDIEADTFWGVQKLYRVVGDFVDLFL